MSLKTPLLVAATAIGLSTLSLAAEAATVRIPLTYTFAGGPSTGSAGTGYFDIDDSLLAPNTLIFNPGNVNQVQDFSLTFTGLAGSPSTTTFTLANLTNWSFATDSTGTIINTNFISSTNADGYELHEDDVFVGSVFGNGQETFYNITPGTPGPVATPEPGTVVALLGLGLGVLASRGKKQA